MISPAHEKQNLASKIGDDRSSGWSAHSVTDRLTDVHTNLPLYVLRWKLLFLVWPELIAWSQIIGPGCPRSWNVPLDQDFMLRMKPIWQDRALYRLLRWYGYVKKEHCKSGGLEVGAHCFMRRTVEPSVNLWMWTGITPQFWDRCPPVLLGRGVSRGKMTVSKHFNLEMVLFSKLNLNHQQI